MNQQLITFAHTVSICFCSVGVLFCRANHFIIYIEVERGREIYCGVDADVAVVNNNTTNSEILRVNSTEPKQRWQRG